MSSMLRRPPENALAIGFCHPIGGNGRPAVWCAQESSAGSTPDRSRISAALNVTRAIRAGARDFFETISFAGD
jgi:hypothetical protein